MIFWIIIILALSSVLYYLLLKPLISILYLKLQFGDQLKVWYYPLNGFFHHATSSLKKYDDFLENRRIIMRNNPKVKFIVTNILSAPVILLTDPDYVKLAYLEHEKFIKYNVLHYEYLINKGLVFENGEVWKQQRRMLGGSFTFEKLKNRIPMINDVVKQRCKLDSKENLSNFMSYITGEVVIKSFFGKLAEGYMLNNKPAQVEIVDLFSDLINIQMKNPYVSIKQLLLGTIKSWNFFPCQGEKILQNRATELRKTVKEFILKKIDEMQKTPLNNNNDDLNFLEVQVLEYLNQKKEERYQIDVEQIIQQFITLFFAGTDTTATTCGTCLYFLAKYPETQQDLYNEIINVIGQEDVNEVTINQLPKMSAFLQEVLRVKNPAFSSLPRVVKNDTKIKDLNLKKGWMIQICHDMSEQLDNYVDNPEIFDYKRWLNKKDVFKQDNGFVHIPFSSGPRNCIGQHMALMEAKIILTHIIRKYKLELNPNTGNVKFVLKFLNCIENDDCILYKER